MLGDGIAAGPQELSTAGEALAGPNVDRWKAAMEKEIQRKDDEPQSREAGEPLGPRVSSAAPVTYAIPSAVERSEGPETEAP